MYFYRHSKMANYYGTINLETKNSNVNKMTTRYCIRLKVTQRY